MVNEKNIRIFGLGLALLLAAGALLHFLHLHLGIFSILIVFGALLFVLEKSLTWPWVYGLVYGAIAIATALTYAKHTPSIGIVISNVLSILFLFIAIIKYEALIPFYRLWMKGAHFIGLAVTGGVLASVYFFVFTPVRILLRLLGKDHLQRKLKPTQGSYWQKRDQTEVLKERYHQQF